jgi:hypothetical protein
MRFGCFSHYDFVLSCAKIFATIYALPLNKEQINDVQTNKDLILKSKVEPWQPRNKVSIKYTFQFK